MRGFVLRTLKVAVLVAAGVVFLAGCGDTVTPVPDATFTPVATPGAVVGSVRCAVIDAGTHRSVTVGVGDRAVVNGVLAVCETDGYWRAV